MNNYAGIDWASEKHDVCVVDQDGQIVCEKTVAHDEQGLRELCELLITLRVERVALERPDGLLVESLLAASLSVLAIHANQVKAARPRFTISGGKSDRFDAFLIAELCRTDFHRFRLLCPDSDATKALRVLTRSREALVGQRSAIANLLRCELDCFWPAAGNLFSSIDSMISLAFIERYPTPAHSRGLGERRMQAFLSRHRYTGKTTAAELVGRLRLKATGSAGEQELAARGNVVLGLVTALRPLVQQIKELDDQIAAAVRCHPDGQIFLSFFAGSTLIAGTLLAEIGDDRARYPTNGALAADAGMSPVAIESGKRRNAGFRRGCDKRLRRAMAVLADTTRHSNPWARTVYQDARARGKSHPHAIRILGRCWTRVLWRCWQDGATYDPGKHGNLRQLQIEGG